MRRLPPLRGFGLGLGFALLFLASCDLNTEYFAEYRGVNLLGNYDFSAEYSAGKPKWNLTTSTDFMTWERIGASTNPASDLARDLAAGTPTTGPDGKSPVYRLEIKNLIPNGDFEDASVTPEGSHTLPSFWSPSYYNASIAPATTSPYAINYGASPSPTTKAGSINGRSLGWRAGQPGDQLRINLYAAATSLSPTAWSATAYRFHMNFINVAGKSDLAIFLYTAAGAKGTNSTLADDAFDWTYRIPIVDKESDSTSIFHVSKRFLTDTVGTEGRILVLGPNTVSGQYAAVADNFRLLPDTETLGAQAVFPSLSSGSNTLLPGSRSGMYTFSFQLRDDPTAGTLNRFIPEVLSIKLTARVKSGTPTYQATITRPSEGWSTWTKQTFAMGFDFVNSDAALGTEPALSITISPTYSATGAADVGSVLVSQPVLTFNP